MPQHLFREIPIAARATGHPFTRASVSGQLKWLDASGAGSGYLPIGGGTLTGGLSFGSVLASSLSSLSSHIDLYGGQFGFNVSPAPSYWSTYGDSLNLVVGGAPLWSFANGTTAVSLFEHAGNDAYAPQLWLNKARGGFGSEASPQQNDYIGQLVFAGWGATKWVVGAEVAGVAQTASPSDTVMSSKLMLMAAFVGGSLQEQLWVGDSLKLTGWALPPASPGLVANGCINAFNVIDSLGNNTQSNAVALQAGTTVGARVELHGYYSGSPVAGIIVGRSSRGTVTAPAVSVTNDSLLRLYGYAQTGTPSWGLSTQLSMSLIDTAPGPAALGGQFLFQTPKIGSSTLTSVLTLNAQLATFAEGVSLGTAFAPGGATDLSRHLALYGTTYGVGVTNGYVNVVANGVAAASLGPAAVFNAATSMTFNTPNTYQERADATATAATRYLRKARGAIGSETAVLQNDMVYDLEMQAYTGSSWLLAARMLVTVQEPTPSATVMGTALGFYSTYLGSTACYRGMWIGDGQYFSAWALPPISAPNYINNGSLTNWIISDGNGVTPTMCVLGHFAGSSVAVGCMTASHNYYAGTGYYIRSYSGRGNSGVAANITASATNDYMFRIQGFGQAGQPTPAWVQSVQLDSQIIDTTPGSGAMGGQWRFLACAIGSTTLTTLMTLAASGITVPVLLTPTGGLGGVTNATNAPAGGVGETIATAGTSQSLTSGTTLNVGSITLTAGDWDIDGVVFFVPAGSTTISALAAGVNTTSATLPTTAQTISGGQNMQQLQLTFTVGATQQINTGRCRQNVSSSTTIYLVAQATFGTSTMTCNGYISARRRR